MNNVPTVLLVLAGGGLFAAIRMRSATLFIIAGGLAVAGFSMLHG